MLIWWYVEQSEGVVAARDLCMHRGSPLSMGRVQGDEIVCAYHGWRYGPEGECVRIPSQPASTRIPPACPAHDH